MRLAFRIAVLLILVLALLPIANWIPGGHGMEGYGNVVGDWWTGALIVLGGGAVVAILSTRSTALWREGLWQRISGRLAASPVAASAGISLVAFVAYATVAIVVFDARPILMDELMSVIHARIFASGQLSLPVPTYPEFFSALQLIDTEGRVYSQFPAGGPAMLALGELVGAGWLVGPLCGALAVAAFISLVRVVEARATVVYAAALLFAFAPFVMFMSGTFMNHVPVMMWLLISFAALGHVTGSPHARPWLSLLLGLGFGCAATIRPLDAVVFAVPAGAWLLWRAVHDRPRWIDVVAAGAGVALPIAALLYVNDHTTGSALRFGYNVLWGAAHDPGFHAAPYGDPHTPARGLELINLYLLRLQTYLYETPVPSLIPAFAALLLSRGMHRVDRYLLATSALLLGVYFTYWHDGFHLGPRFVYVLAPVIALWTARFLPALRERLGDGTAYRTAAYGSLIALAMSAGMLIPLRARLHAATVTRTRWDADSAAAAAGARNALVFVRESWGAQIIPRMWALGISRTDADGLYRKVDTCILELGVRSLEASARRGPEALAALRPLLRDSLRVVRTTLSPDYTERQLPGIAYPSGCRQRILEDNGGFTVFTPLLLARGGGNIYARDLHERNAVLLAEHPERPVYLLRPASSEKSEVPQFIPLSRDSLMKAWGASHP